MRAMLALLVVVGSALAFAGPQESTPPVSRAFVGAHILPIGAPEIPRGVLVVEGTRIVALGAEGEVAIPAGAERIDVGGKVLMPGLVCTHSHVGEPWGADQSGPLQPDVSSFDAMDVTAASVHRARAGGLTTINAMPGSGHLMGGKTAYLKLRKGRTVEELAYRDTSGAFHGGLKMANGTNPIGRRDGHPGTRAKAAALVRQRFLDAREYQRKLREAGDDVSKRPAPNLGMETLVEVLDGRRIVHHHTHRADDVMTVLRLAEEFGFRVVLHHVSEGWVVAEEIAKANVPCSIIVIDAPGGKLEAAGLSFDTGAVLEKAGVRVAVHTDDYITDSRLFLRSAAFAVRGGMSREKALEAVTLAGAEMLDLADRVGSLAVGKDADFVVLDGDPLSVYTRVLETWVEGVKVFDLSDPADRLVAEGGPGAGDRQVGVRCCVGIAGWEATR
jgi:imidazolonepropionase-like amidohydrolase